MNGLIWAGLGEGIAKAGTTFGAYMAKGIEEDWKAKRDAELEKEKEERQLALLDKKNQLEDANEKKQALIRSDAEKSAGDGLLNKMFESYKAKVRADERNYPGMEPLSDEQLKEVFKENYLNESPEYTAKESERRRAVLEKISSDSRGASAKTIEQATKDVDLADRAEQKAREDTRKEAEQKSREKLQAAQADAAGKRADAALIAASRVGGGRGGSDEEKGGERKRWTTLLTDAKAELRTVEGQLDKLEEFGPPKEGSKNYQKWSDLQSRKAQAIADRKKYQSLLDGDDQKSAPVEDKPASTKVEAPKTANSPPISALQEGKNTTFGNGQVWTLVGGKPKRVR